MKKVITYIVTVAAGMFAAACSELDERMDIPQEVAVNPSIRTEVVQSRAASAPLATLNPSAELILTYEDATSATYVYNKSAAKWYVKPGTTPLYWDKIAPDAAGEYPFTAMAPGNYTAGGSVANQATEEAYLAADLLATSYKASERKEVLNLELEHQFAQLAVTLAATDTDFDLSTATLLIKGAKPGYNSTAGVTGDAADIVPLRQAGNGASFIAVLPQQTVGAAALKMEFTIEVAGIQNSYTWTNAADITFTAGVTQAVNLTVSGTGVVLNDIAVTDWTPATPISGAVQMVVAGTSRSASGQEAGFDTFILWKNDNEKDFITYNKVDDAWKLAETDTPFYLDKVAATDRFHARHTPSVADVVTDIKDILEARNVTVQGGQLTLEFKHINSKLTVNLLKGNDFDLDLAGATVKLLDFQLTATGATNSFIMEPTTSPIASGTQIVSIGLGALEYNATLDKDLELTAGLHTTLNITLNPTGVTLAAVSVTPWTDATITANADIATNIDLSKLPGEGTVELSHGATTANYSWNGTALSLKSGSNHIYWENITPTASYTFKLKFTPAAITTPELDVLTGEATVRTHGAALSFASLAHINSLVNVTLTRGSTYTQEEWEAIEATTAVIQFDGLSKANHVINGVGYGTAVGSIFQPKATIAADDKLTVTVPAAGTLPENVIEISLKHLMPGLEAGKKYDITLTLNKTGISASNIKAGNWTDMTGDGSMNYD